MNLPKTILAPAEWVAAQDPAHWLIARELIHCASAAASRRRTDRLAGRLAVKRLLSETFDVDPLTYEIGAEGPAPALINWHGPRNVVISLSHSHGLGAASWEWAEKEGAVGVDAQHIRLAHPGLTARVLTAQEREQGADVLLLWALKEAAIKARRRAWGRALREIEVTLDTPQTEWGTAQIVLPNEPPLCAHYTRHQERQENWWLARAAR